MKTWTVVDASSGAINIAGKRYSFSDFEITIKFDIRKGVYQYFMFVVKSDESNHVMQSVRSRLSAGWLSHFAAYWWNVNHDLDVASMIRIIELVAATLKQENGKEFPHDMLEEMKDFLQNKESLRTQSAEQEAKASASSVVSTLDRQSALNAIGLATPILSYNSPSSWSSQVVISALVENLKAALERNDKLELQIKELQRQAAPQNTHSNQLQ